MIQRTYTLNGLNQDGLNAQLGAAFGALYGGLAVRETREAIIVTINLADSASEADIDQLNSLVVSHDPQQLTPEQQARKNQADKLAAARRDDQGTELDPADYSGESLLIQTLARKVAWLEQEIADLRSS